MAAEADTLSEFVREADQSGLALPGDLDDIYSRLHEPHWADGVRRRDTTFEWPARAVWPVVALAQHHGIATRFLDWTRSSLVACYFAAVDAVKNERRGKLAVWAFSTTMTNVVYPGRKRVVLVTAPYASNPNLRAQEGVHIALALQDPVMSDPADRDDVADCARMSPDGKLMVLISVEARQWDTSTFPQECLAMQRGITETPPRIVSVRRLRQADIDWTEVQIAVSRLGHLQLTEIHRVTTQPGRTIYVLAAITRSAKTDTVYLRVLDEMWESFRLGP